eukprot:10899711-Karenia_brevis.AAC.1
MSKVGLKVLGVDHASNKDTPLCKAVKIDLTTEHGKNMFMRIMSEKNVVFVHFAPPCGTATRAREIRRKGVDPKPLRSSDFPD